MGNRQSEVTLTDDHVIQELDLKNLRARGDAFGKL